MPTLKNMQDRCKAYLYGFSSDQQQMTYLSANIGTTDTTFFVGDATQISRGLIEVDGAELMQVMNVNRSTNSVTLQPWGRGVDSTTATSHLANAQVENNPVYPGARLTEAINDVIQSVYPDLFQVATTQLTKNAVQYSYAMPSDCEEVISVKYQIIGPSLINPYVRRWRYDKNPIPADLGSGTGGGLFIGEEITPGRQIEVVYRKEPAPLVNLTDDFATVTGLPATAADVVLYGAMGKLSVGMEGPRLLINTVESSERAAFIQAGSASKVSQYYMQLFTQRLGEEARKLADRYIQPTHFNS